jgi:Uma2 family endonuclease
VLSPNSARYDRVQKRPLYQRHVPEYWIVDPDARLFERWRPGDARPEVLTETLEWHPESAADPLRLDVADFFARLLDDSD